MNMPKPFLEITKFSGIILDAARIMKNFHPLPSFYLSSAARCCTLNAIGSYTTSLIFGNGGSHKEKLSKIIQGIRAILQEHNAERDGLAHFYSVNVEALEIPLSPDDLTHALNL